jgi:Cu+-exporting ATPase
MHQSSNVQSLPGFGVTGLVDGLRVLIGNARLMQERGVDIAPADAEAARLMEKGGTVIFVATQTHSLKPEAWRLLGILAIADTTSRYGARRHQASESDGPGSDHADRRQRAHGQSDRKSGCDLTVRSIA